MDCLGGLAVVVMITSYYIKSLRWGQPMVYFQFAGVRLVWHGRVGCGRLHEVHCDGGNGSSESRVEQVEISKRDWRACDRVFMTVWR